MKANLKSILGLAALGMTLLATTVPTWAGKVSTPEVFIHTNQVGISANGSMVGARYSADSVQYIRCEIWDDSYIRCQARDKTFSSFSCDIIDRRLADIVRGMSDSSYLSFHSERNGGRCREIKVYNGTENLK